MTASTLACQADPGREKAVRRAAELIRRGGLVVFPTETVYGVGASALRDRGLQRLRAVKQRGGDRPFTLHVPRTQDVLDYLGLGPQSPLGRLVRKTMPGPITLVADVAADQVEAALAARGLPGSLAERLCHRGTIGLRCPDHPVATDVLAEAAEPVVASSANAAGQAAPRSAEEAAEALGAEVDLILDGGTARYARASTIARVSAGAVEVLRAGIYDQTYLEKLMQRMILFVCSGNTCRSPMAEMIGRAAAAQRLGVPADALAEHGLRILSAGAYAVPGAAMSPEAGAALEQLNIPTTLHHARILTAEMIREADAIYCMSDSHRAAVADLAADHAHKAQLLDPEGPIDDPIGAGMDVYLESAKRIRQLIERRLDELEVGRR